MPTLHKPATSTLLSAVALGLALRAAVAAEPQVAATSDADQAAPSLEEIVVTGTFIRGAPPAGAEVVGITEEQVQQTGATTTSQLLETIPQMGSFNAYQGVLGGFNSVTTSRPNLRNLPGFNTSGGSSTLVLLDGHRIVGMGIQSTSPDPDIVPPSIIERVEIVPDGGSAIYGSDAVAGVINFITRKKFDGVEVGAHYGWGDDYSTADASATVGHSWSGGSAFIAYNFAEHQAVFGRERDYVKMWPTTLSGVPFPITSLKCTPGNVVPLFPASSVYALPYSSGSAKPGTANQCDESDDNSIYPKEYRHSVMAGVSQDLSDSVRLDVRGFYTNRVINQWLGSDVTTSYIGPTFLSISGVTPSPFLASHLTSAGPFEIQQVYYNYGGPNASFQSNSLNTWGIAPTLSVDLGRGWQWNTLFNFGQSRVEQHTSQGNATALNNGIAAGLFNPYDPASSNPTALEAATSYESYGLSHQQLINVRSVADGDLFSLPGGEVKLAAGIEYNHESLDSQKGTVVPGTQDTGYAGLSIGSTLITPASAPLPVVDLSRHIEAAFAEVVVPIFGQGNALRGLRELNLSVSGRYDHYSDFGGTFNPKFGLTYKPLDWLKLRGAWGRSFVAPSLADSSLATPTNFIWVTGLSFLLPPPALVASGQYPPPKPGQYTPIILGNTPGLQPQTAKTTSFGFDLDPPVVPGLTLSLTYWRIDYDNVIALPDFTNTALYWGSFGSKITVAPTQAQLNQAIAGANVVSGTACSPQPSCVYAILDARTANLGNYRADGLDFAEGYTHPTSFGSIDFGINGVYDLDVVQSPVAGEPYADLLAANYSRFQMRVSAGAQIGRLRAQAFLDHRQGYDLNPPAGLAPQQTHVASFDVVNLFFRYDFDPKGALHGLSGTLNIDNLFDRDPPVYRTQDIVPARDGYTNGFTLGRVFLIGVDKKF
jgi:iron complex outermembrane receptor protein